MQADVMNSFNDRMEALNEEKTALHVAFRDAGKVHAKARKQLAGMEQQVAEAQAIRDEQQRAVTEAQQSADQLSEASAGLPISPKPCAAACINCHSGTHALP